MKSDPKHFWDLINKLNDGQSNKDANIEEINTDEFTQFFKNLNKSSAKNKEFHNYILNNLNTLIGNHTANINNAEFNTPLSEEEILKAVKTLNNGKASASDCVSNEMIKHGMPVLLKPLHKLFNHIFNNGTFPKSWNESIVTLIHKKGSKYDPNNYRGISITSNLGKLFNKVIYNRLQNLLTIMTLYVKIKLVLKKAHAHLITYLLSNQLLITIKYKIRKYLPLL